MPTPSFRDYANRSAPLARIMDYRHWLEPSILLLGILTILISVGLVGLGSAWSEP
jgi:hypothetical protein